MSHPNTDRDERVSDSEERLWKALKYRIQAAHESRSRVRKQEHLDQALLYLKSLAFPAAPTLTTEEAELIVGAIPLQSGLLDSQAAESDEWRSVAEKYQALVARTENDAATRMRDLCVAKVKELQLGAGLTYRITAALESLTLEVEQEK